MEKNGVFGVHPYAKGKMVFSGLPAYVKEKMALGAPPIDGLRYPLPSFCAYSVTERFKLLIGLSADGAVGS